MKINLAPLVVIPALSALVFLVAAMAFEAQERELYTYKCILKDGTVVQSAAELRTVRTNNGFIKAFVKPGTDTQIWFEGDCQVRRLSHD
jgi:hypothetical protein